MHGRVGADRRVRNGMMRGIQGPEGEVHQDFCLGGVWREESCKMFSLRTLTIRCKFNKDYFMIKLIHAECICL